MELDENEKEKRQEIRERRYAVIIGLWEFLTGNGTIDSTKFKLSRPLVQEAVEHYVEDWSVIRTRYRIEKEIQLHKVAGLMTASLLRYRPIIPLHDKFEDRKEIYINEYYAILHGLSICAEVSEEESRDLTKKVWFNQWFDDFLHLVHRRNYTAESLAFVFETLSLFQFPKNWELSDKPEETP